MEFPATPDMLLRLLHHTNWSFGKDLSGSKDEQLATGLDFIFFTVVSDIATCFWNKALPQLESDSTVLAIQ